MKNRRDIQQFNIVVIVVKLLWWLFTLNFHTHFKKICLLFSFVCICACMRLCALEAERGLKASDPLKLELQTVVELPTVAGRNQMLVFCMSSSCSEPLSHLSSLNFKKHSLLNHNFLTWKLKQKTKILVCLSYRRHSILQSTFTSFCYNTTSFKIKMSRSKTKQANKKTLY